MLAHYPRFVADLRVLFAFFTTLTARFAGFAVFATDLLRFATFGNSNTGNERGSTCCAKFTAASAASRAVDPTATDAGELGEAASQKTLATE